MSMLLHGLSPVIDRAERAVVAGTFQVADGDEVQSIT
jgi:hypothetical protein